MTAVAEFGVRLGIASTCVALGVAPSDLLSPTLASVRPATATILPTSPQR
jgi:hypothetical protein